MSHHRRERTLSASLGRISLHFARKINIEAQILDGKETQMKTYRKELWFQVPTRRAFINITPEVVQALRESGIQEGLCLVNAMHITASVFINDDESGLHLIMSTA